MNDDAKLFYKQCSKAVEIQLQFDPEDHNTLYDHTIRHGTSYKFKEYRTFLPKFNLDGALVFDAADGYEWLCIWIPNQNQLQAILTKHWWSFGCEVHKVIYMLQALQVYIRDYIFTRDYDTWPSSFDQLWLEFVMRDLYNKAWTGENWDKQGEDE